MTNRILVVEDELVSAKIIERVLQMAGYQIDIAKDGLEGLEKALQNPPDLIILDRLLPKMDGIELCKRLRESSNTPIIMLSSLGRANERVAGLDSGANDYMAKPFDFQELIARVRVQLRKQSSDALDVIVFSDLKISLKKREVLRGEELLRLTPKEFDLLLLFMKYPQEVLTRDRIMDVIWGWEFEGDDNILEVYLRRLRQKMEIHDKPRLLHTARGVGYVLREEP